MKLVYALIGYSRYIHNNCQRSLFPLVRCRTDFPSVVRTFFLLIDSLVTVNELAAGDQNQSLLMELNEGEISNASALIDPNETQLPTGILKFPTNEIIDGINKEIDDDFYKGGQDDKLPSPKSPMDIVNNRLKEYEELIRDLNENKKQLTDLLIIIQLQLLNSK